MQAMMPASFAGLYLTCDGDQIIEIDRSVSAFRCDA
jgi:hypothetical protein